MKFSKNLSNLIEQTLPDWRDQFLSYKDLKKQLKLIYPKDGGPSTRGPVSPNKRPRLDRGDAASEEMEREEAVVTKEVIDFVRLLEDEIDKFNAFFVDKEEEYIIRLKVFYRFLRYSLELGRLHHQIEVFFFDFCDHR